MRIALLAPLPPEKNGIADYAGHFKAALEADGVEVLTPLAGCGAERGAVNARVSSFDWSGVDLVHGELGGGRLREFHALELLRMRYPALPLTATIHDPERLVWRQANLPRVLAWTERFPGLLQQAAVVLTDPFTLRQERKLAHGMNRLFTLTGLGASCLRQRMGLADGRVAVVPHGNLDIAPAALPDLDVMRLLYFGFIYRGKGIEDLLQALARVLQADESLHGRLRLTLAGGTAAEMAFDGRNDYLDELRELIGRLQLHDSIDWRLDLPREEIAQVIQQHHVMVLPYRESQKLRILGEQRGTSGALSWAAACGRGAITSDARAFAEEVSSGNGMTYAQGNVEALAQALQGIARQPQLAAAWADRARSIGRERRWSSVGRRFHEHFDELCRQEPMP